MKRVKTSRKPVELFVLAFCLVIFSPLGCQSPDGYIDAHREAAEERIRQIDAIAEMIESIPPLEEDGLSVDGPAPDFRIRLSLFDDENPDCNGRVVYVEELGPDATEPDLFLDLQPTRWLFNTRSLLETGRHPPNEYHPDGLVPAEVDHIRPLFETTEGLRYLLVMRTGTEVPPAISGSDGFTPGVILGEMLLFDVTTEDYLGGFRVNAMSSEEVYVRSGGSLPAQDYLNSDLLEQLRLAIRAQLGQLLPAAGLPFTEDGRVWQ